MKKIIIFIKHNLTILSKSIRRFGLIDGFSIFLNSSLGLSESVKLKEFPQPIYLRKGTSDLQVFRDMFLDPVNEYWIEFEPKIIIDAGANIGLYTLALMQKYPNAQYFCIEPDGDNFATLQKNLGHYANVKLYHAGIWNKDSYLKVTDKYDLGKWAMIVEETEEVTDVKGISFGSIVKENNLDRIDILKVDIETSEKYVFQENYSDWLKISKVVAIEIHDTIERGCGQTFMTAVQKTFKSYCYYIQLEKTIIVNNDI